MKFSQSDSCIKIWSFADISGTNFVLITCSTLRPIKDNLGIKTLGVHCIHCECGTVYMGQASRTIVIRWQEYIRHLQHGQTEKSAAEEHLLNTGEAIQFAETCRLNRTTTNMNWIVNEAIEIQLHLGKFIREAGYIFSCTWQLVISVLKCSPEPAIESPDHVQWHFDYSH